MITPHEISKPAQKSAKYRSHENNLYFNANKNLTLWTIQCGVT